MCEANFLCKAHLTRCEKQCMHDIFCGNADHHLLYHQPAINHVMNAIYMIKVASSKSRHDAGSYIAVGYLTTV